ncbi:N-acetyltransferase [Kribbella sandramycini]|uniref:N-acetyltransferase n=1 Tax=Kribbella sandramycini TaxID=60450 RepID=A0A7Y4KU43_9ACTN|nr:GNAT family N-acetyltransferase [Kribbella sandramycini]MBB6568725.1 GNAT superfamily N-acetyltransferase [Kribbella sandramycini]NOL38692.1 N-acetyltransferase [Kribbella sandramycini]
MGSSILPPAGEELTNGWEPELDPADSVVRQAVLAHASWAADGARRAGKPWYDGAAWAGGVLGEAGTLTNWIVLKQPVDPVAVVADIARELPGSFPYLFVSAWPTGDLRDCGLELAGHPPLMVRFPGTATVPPTTDLDIRQVTDAAGLADAERVLVEGYPIPELQPFRPGAMYSPSFLDGSDVWVGYDGNIPLATATAHHAAGLTVVESVAVLPAARGRGAGAALTWAATTHHPTHPAALIASDAGQPVYQRLNYHRLQRWTVWVRP